MKRGKLIVLSGPSGVGKGTIREQLMKIDDLNLVYSISCTTRLPRNGETDGVEYFFITDEQFNKMIEEDGFLEHARFVDHQYGTPRDNVEKWLNQGKNVLLEIEVNGALQVMDKGVEDVSIFIVPPTMEELERRIRGRKTEDEEVIQGRLAQAKEELATKDHYDYNVCNDDLQRASDEIAGIIMNIIHKDQE